MKSKISFYTSIDLHSTCATDYFRSQYTRRCESCFGGNTTHIIPIIIVLIIVLVVLSTGVGYLYRERLNALYTRYRDPILTARNHATMLFITFQVGSQTGVGYS